MSMETVSTETSANVPPAAAPGAVDILPTEDQTKMVDSTAPDSVAPAALEVPMMKNEFLQQVPMDSDMLMNVTASSEPKVAFHAGEVVVIECPSPDAYWLGIAGKNIPELDDQTRAKIEEQEQQAAESGAGVGDGMPRLPPEFTVPIRWLERVASFENGDDLYRAGREERVKRTMILCLAHVTVTDGNLLMNGQQNHYIVTMAERHRLIRFMANGGDSIMEESDDGDVVDGARVAALVSRATVNNTAFFLVKWAGFENAAMTWEPMNLLTQCCPDLVARFDDAPYKLAIQFPNQEPPNMPIHPLAQDGGLSAPGTPDLARGGRGGRQSGRGGRGRGGKARAERSPAPLTTPSPIIANSSSPAPPPLVPAPPSVVPAPVPVPVSIAVTTEPQPPYLGTPATLTDTSKGPISLSQLPMALQQQQSQP